MRTQDWHFLFYGAGAHSFHLKSVMPDTSFFRMIMSEFVRRLPEQVACASNEDKYDKAIVA